MLQSKKAKAFLFSMSAIILADKIGVSSGTISVLQIITLGYLGTQGAVDYGHKKAERN